MNGRGTTRDMNRSPLGVGENGVNKDGEEERGQHTALTNPTAGSKKRGLARRRGDGGCLNIVNQADQTKCITSNAKFDEGEKHAVVPNRVICFFEVNEGNPSVMLTRTTMEVEASGGNGEQGRDLLQTFMFPTKPVLEWRKQVTTFEFRLETILEEGHNDLKKAREKCNWSVVI